MFILQFLGWWYGSGWLAAAKGLAGSLRGVAGSFSLGILLRTLFAPWKRTVNLAGPNTPLQVRFQWWVGNQISRLIGFLIRVITLATALAMITLIGIVGLAGLILWPLLPFGWLISLYLGITQ